MRLLLCQTSRKETPEEFWRQLFGIEKECNFNKASVEELLISNYQTAITNKKLPDKIMKEKFLELKKPSKELNGTHRKRKVKRTEYRKR